MNESLIHWAYKGKQVFYHQASWSMVCTVDCYLLGRSRVQIPAREIIFNSELKGIINLNCDMVYSIHGQRLVQVEHMHPPCSYFCTMIYISNGFGQNGGHLSGFQMVRLPDFRSHSKSRPFATHSLLDLSKSRLGQITDPHCILLWGIFNKTTHVGAILFMFLLTEI